MYLCHFQPNNILGRPKRKFRGSYILLLIFFFFFFFFSQQYLRAFSVDRRETLPRDRKNVLFHNSGPKIWGPPPSKKKTGAKHVQNSGRFRTTSNFVRKYPRNRSRYPKSEKYGIHSDSSRVRRKSTVNFGLVDSLT